MRMHRIIDHTIDRETGFVLKHEEFDLFSYRILIAEA